MDSIFTSSYGNGLSLLTAPRKAGKKEAPTGFHGVGRVFIEGHRDFTVSRGLHAASVKLHSQCFWSPVLFHNSIAFLQIIQDLENIWAPDFVVFFFFSPGISEHKTLANCQLP